MIGERVTWEFWQNNEMLREHGRVVAVERANGQWHVLVLADSGHLRSPDPASIRPENLLGDPLEALKEGQEACAALEYLEKHLEENFPDTAAGGGPVEWAASLLAQLKAELIEIGTERDNLKQANEGLAKDLKEVKFKYKKLKERGEPKGPDRLPEHES